MADVHLCTWNVRYFSQGFAGVASHPRTLLRVARLLATWNPPLDVIALQEVEDRSVRSGLHREPQLTRLTRALGPRFRGLYFPAHRYGPAGWPVYTTGLAVLVRDSLEVLEHNAGAPHDVTHVRLPAFRALKQRRVAAYLRLRPRGGGSPFAVYNTHLSLPAFLEVGPHRVPQAMGDGSNQRREVANLLRAVGRHRADEAVLVGDFNVRPGSPAYRAVVEAGWHDATPTAQRSIATAAFLHHRMHIDHVFGTAGIRFDRLQTCSIDDARFSGLSDHAPKVATFRLPGDRPGPASNGL